MNNTNKLPHLNSNLSMGDFESRDDLHKIQMSIFHLQGSSESRCNVSTEVVAYISTCCQDDGFEKIVHR
jgi:hypothetical protein